MVLLALWVKERKGVECGRTVCREPALPSLPLPLPDPLQFDRVVCLHVDPESIRFFFRTGWDPSTLINLMDILYKEQ